MNAQELKNAYHDLYGQMATSKNPENMKIFGNVETEMFTWFADNKPDAAQEWLDKLESIRWHQYLTTKEAQKIIDGMDPKAPWPRDAWKTTMEQMGLPLAEEPNYNSCALWVEMNKIYSDFGEEIASLLGKPLSPTDKDIITACYRMALKNLKDKDGIYDIRKYFGL